MHNSRFLNRRSEIAWLESCWRAPSAEMLIIYGRRRVGKTCLIEQFIKKKPHVYYLCSKGVEREQLELLSERIGAAFGDDSLRSNPFRNWDAAFRYVSDRTKRKKYVLVIDEFPFLVRANPAVPSIFQKYWDEYLSKTQIKLILCGSSIAMMESELLAYRSPLYGRRTGQWKVLPLKFADVLEFFTKPNLSHVIPFFSVTGGVPFYIVQLDRTKPIIENIRENIARKGRVLYEEGESLIKEELPEPQTYFSMLRAVAESRTRQCEIANAIGMPATTITRYLATFMRLGFLERRVPVTEKARTKKAHYLISDPFMQFWFRYIYPNKAAIEEDDYSAIERSLSDFNLHVSTIFERVCTEALRTVSPFPIQKAGSWWGAYNEAGERKIAKIDIVGLNDDTRDILFAECKWQDSVNAGSVFAGLKSKAGLVKWHNGKRAEHYVIFAKTFGKKIKNDELYLIDLKDMHAVFANKKLPLP